MSEFRKVLRNRNFLFLWSGQIISQLGDRLGQMALIAFVYLRNPGSTLEIAKVLSFTIIPVFLIGPIAGVYVDRWDRRRTMLICDFLRSVLVLTIPVFLFYSKNMLPIYIMIFIIFCIGRFFIPAKLSILPELVGNNELLIANSLVNVTGMIAAIIGFGVSGVIVEWLGAKSGFYLDSLSFFISGLLIFLINRKMPGAASKVTAPFSSRPDEVSLRGVSQEIAEIIRKSVFQEIKDGVVYFIKNKGIRVTAGISFALWSALGSIYVVLIVFVQKALHSATKDIGLLIMFLGGGLFLGSLIYGRFGQRFSHYKTIFVSLIFTGAMLALIVLALGKYPYFWVAAGLVLLLGLLVAPIMTASNTIIHNSSDNQMLGKIFSSLEIIMHLGFLLFMFITGFLAERFSHASIILTVSAAVSLLGLVNLACYRKVRWAD